MGTDDDTVARLKNKANEARDRLVDDVAGLDKHGRPAVKVAVPAAIAPARRLSMHAAPSRNIALGLANARGWFGRKETQSSSLTVTLDYTQDIYAARHVAMDIPIVKSIRIENHGGTKIANAILEISISRPFGMSRFSRTLTLSSGVNVIPEKSDTMEDAGDSNPIRLNFDAAHWKSMDTDTFGQVDVSISAAGTRLFNQTYDLIFRRYFHCPSYDETMVAFVRHQSPAIKEIVSVARASLRTSASEDSFEGYQGNDDSVDRQVKAIYEALGHVLRVGYSNPLPGGWEWGATGQFVRSPEEVLSYKSGTCMDLALLFAACLENIGVNPVLFLIPGHLFLGYWRQDNITLIPSIADIILGIMRGDGSSLIVNDWGKISSYISGEILVPLNSVTFTRQGSASFSECIKEGLEYLRHPGLFSPPYGLLDIAPIRPFFKIKPL